MKNIFLSVVLSAFVAFIAVGQTEQSFGAKITRDNAVSVDKFKEEIKGKDSLKIKIDVPIIEACKVKGCWMNVDMGNGQTMMVRFKDYGFFVPKDSGGKRAVIEGYAYTETVSVDMLKHYAEDAGKSKKEIKAITQPETRLTFTADGVIIY
ncbi:MAG: DUF4920 domain-containing protein [Sphingobacteriales bacterium JAD_PAG50586_3]|nr:MAG: DUF4920 domain-containing protein [Sphingobacteriales bacterium JAD_PAG50586_3]